MSLGVGHIIRLTNFFSQGTIEAVMVSYWEVDAMDGALPNSGWAEFMQHGIMDIARVKEVMSVNAKAYRTVFDDLTVDGEYGEYTGDISGTMSGTPAPSFVSLSVKQIVPSHITRSGYKRIPFIGEDAYGGNANNVGIVTKTALETFFGTPVPMALEILGVDAELTLTPLVIGRTLDIDGHYVLDMDKIQYVTAASLQNNVTTQNSRKS